MAVNLTSSDNKRKSWQFSYRLALLYEALEELPEAEAVGLARYICPSYISSLTIKTLQ